MSNSTKTVTLAGGCLEAYVGGRGSGPTLVFTHYWGGSAGTWDEVVRRLPSEQATVRFDQRGWGTSRELPGPYALGQLADDLLRVIEECVAGPFVLVGHSMGGKVSQLVAARRPAGLAGMVLIAPAPALPAAVVTEEYRQGLSHAYDSAGTVGNALDHVLTAVALSPRVRDAVIRDSLAAPADARTEWPLRGIAQDITEQAQLIDTPVTVLAGERDKVEPPEVLRECLLPYVPHATMTSVPGAGHLLPLEAPQAVADAIGGFLASLRGREETVDR
ncbi:hydrolase [Streptomyces sp. CB02923]|uniref:alpha/beta fold hydrolase n=1 Tax=Streptomyces sp. CB02923 TaxID=1718985 RepID=UPI00093EB087|nr:alpha/beta hydrolase [Streptomyces sp. CB02923]OKI06216.1 hydrolase [Streptomyces sp. CB02923]